MAQKKIIKIQFFLLLSCVVFQSFGGVSMVNKTHSLLMNVNKNWKDLKHEISYDFTPSSEQELVQLHLMNVVAFLERQSISNLNIQQQKNRLRNIEILHKYCREGNFPKNNLTSFRTPIFIDTEYTHCAVGHLMKESGYEQMAQEIAHLQLYAYLEDIVHPQLMPWKTETGLSLFELALIQPTYGPPIPVCATPSPIEWDIVARVDSKITQLHIDENSNKIFAISEEDNFGLTHQVNQYSSKNKTWTSVGNQVPGQVLDLAICSNHLYISVLLPDEEYLHQILHLKGNKWEKIAHFDGSITSMQSFQEQLYVLGKFKEVNNSIKANFVVIDQESIQPFRPIGLKVFEFDHISASNSALFFTSNGGIYKFKNDTINYLVGIKYYQYLTNITLDAIEDTLYITSLNIPGYFKYVENRDQTIDLNNMLYGQDYPYTSIHSTKSKMVNGRMMIAGDFRSATLVHQINDERQLVHCEDSTSGHWYGNGLIYEYNGLFYPILDEGIVLDFVQQNEDLYILKKDGTVSHANLNEIEGKISDLIKRTQM